METDLRAPGIVELATTVTPQADGTVASHRLWQPRQYQAVIPPALRRITSLLCRLRSTMPVGLPISAEEPRSNDPVTVFLQIRVLIRP
jgi:hypothetical protein